MLALSQSNEPILTEQAFAEKECKHNKDDTDKTRNNFLVKNSSGDIIFPINDDLILLSKNWDNIIDYEFSSINPSNPFCIWVNFFSKVTREKGYRFTNNVER